MYLLLEFKDNGGGRYYHNWCHKNKQITLQLNSQKANSGVDGRRGMRVQLPVDMVFNLEIVLVEEGVTIVDWRIDEEVKIVWEEKFHNVADKTTSQSHVIDQSVPVIDQCIDLRRK